MSSSTDATRTTTRLHDEGALAGVIIEEVHDQSRLVDIERLQMDVWGMSARDVAPANLLQIIASGARGVRP